MGLWTIAVIAALLVLAVWVSTVYESIRSGREECLRAWRNLEAALDRRLDLLRHLERLAGGLPESPAGLDLLREARESAGDGSGPGDRGAREQRLDHILDAVLEDLDGSGDREIEDLGEELAAARRCIPYAAERYQIAAGRYNASLEAFPTSVMARICRFRPTSDYESAL